MLFYAIRLKGSATTLPDSLTFKDGTQAKLIKNASTPNQAILAFADGRPLPFPFRRIEGEDRSVLEWRRMLHDQTYMLAGFSYDESKGRTKPQELASEAFEASTFLEAGHQVISGLSASDVALYDVFAIDYDYAPENDTADKKEKREQTWASVKKIMGESKLVDASGNERWEVNNWIREKPSVRLKAAYLKAEQKADVEKKTIAEKTASSSASTSSTLSASTSTSTSSISSASVSGASVETATRMAAVTEQLSAPPQSTVSGVVPSSSSQNNQSGAQFLMAFLAALAVAAEANRNANSDASKPGNKPDRK